MKVQIEDKLFIESDENQFMLRKYTGTINVDKKTGKETEAFISLGYYTTLQGVIKKVIQMKLARSEATTLKEVLQEVRRVEREIKALME